MMMIQRMADFEDDALKAVLALIAVKKSGKMYMLMMMMVIENRMKMRMMLLMILLMID
jgi:hypothetical protein